MGDAPLGLGAVGGKEVSSGREKHLFLTCLAAPSTGLGWLLGIEGVAGVGWDGKIAWLVFISHPRVDGGTPSRSGIPAPPRKLGGVTKLQGSRGGGAQLPSFFSCPLLLDGVVLCTRGRPRGRWGGGLGWVLGGSGGF